MGLLDRFGKKRIPEPEPSPEPSPAPPESTAPTQVPGTSISGDATDLMRQALAQARAHGTLTPQMAKMFEQRMAAFSQAMGAAQGGAQGTPQQTEQMLEQRIALLRRAQEQGRAQGTLTPQIDQILEHRIAGLEQSRRLLQGRAQGTLTPEQEQELERQIAANQQMSFLVFPGFTGAVTVPGAQSPSGTSPSPVPPDAPSPGSPYAPPGEASWTGSPFDPPGPAASTGTPFAPPGAPSTGSPFTAPGGGFAGPTGIPDAGDPASRLRQLEDLRRQGLIGDAEYEAQRQRILEGI